jgi:hypothetical protein
MTYYVEAYERAKVLKLEYDQQFEQWMAAVDRGTNKDEALLCLGDVVSVLEKLDAACLDLHRTTQKQARMPEDMVVLS